MAFLVRGFNPPVVIVGEHSPGAVWVVPAALPWASARCVRRDELVPVPTSS